MLAPIARSLGGVFAFIALLGVMRARAWAPTVAAVINSTPTAVGTAAVLGTSARGEAPPSADAVGIGQHDPATRLGAGAVQP